jgi:ribonuclease HII
MPSPRWTHDRKLAKGRLGVVGVDEAGRGCLAGPVVAGCVILPEAFFSFARHRNAVGKINDSKKFAEAERESLFEKIKKMERAGVLYGGTGWASVEEIEEHNIVGATCLAMMRAMDRASEKSDKLWSPKENRPLDLFDQAKLDSPDWTVLVDGRPMKKLPFAHEGLIKGDSLSLSIAMASLLAKVSRDRWMKKLDSEFPLYNFASNKGYGSPVHLKALKDHGPTTYHRPRFLRNLLDQAKEVPSESFHQSQLSLA